MLDRDGATVRAVVVGRGCGDWTGGTSQSPAASFAAATCASAAWVSPDSCACPARAICATKRLTRVMHTPVRSRRTLPSVS